MSRPLPMLVVSLPTRTFGTTLSALRALEGSGADAAEVRFDRWEPAELPRAPELFPAPLPLIATYRSHAEGGEGSDLSGERQRLLRGWAALPFSYVDVEAETDRALAREWAQTPGAPSRILSRHLLPDSSSAEIARWTSGHQPRDVIVKVVVPCDLTRFYRDVRPLVEAGRSERRETILTTGPSGSLSRALAPRFGWAMVFAAPPGLRAPEAVEPAQVPVDRLRRFYEAGEDGRLFGLVGEPVDHSLSPAIHHLWMTAEGRGGLYIPLEVRSAAELKGMLAPLAADGVVGLNVTHPWKEEALGVAARASGIARRAGCANVLVRSGTGWEADNTDVAAVGRRLRELRQEGAWSGDHLVLVGSGGAARAVLAATEGTGARIEILARNRAAAQRLASEFGVEIARPPGSAAPLVIQATTAGRGEGAGPDVAWEERVGPGTYVLDFVYRPDRRSVGEGTKRRGGRYEDGSRLLVYQAAESYQRFWGTRPAMELEARALSEVLCAG